MLTILTALAVALPQAQDFSWTGELRSDQRLAVHNIIGEVRVERASGRRIEVTATRRAGRYGDPRDVEITAVPSARGVTICVRYPGMVSDRRNDREDSDGCRSSGTSDNRNRNDTEVNFVVRLPAGVTIEAATVAGSVVARDLSGESKVTSVSGSVTVEGFSGSSLEATTVSGNVRLRNIRGREIQAETVSGDVTFQGTLDRDGEYDFQTLSGTVLVELPEGSGAEVSASTFSGRVRMPDGVSSTSSRRRSNRFSGQVGGGGARLSLESFSGSVELRIGGGR